MASSTFSGRGIVGRLSVSNMTSTASFWVAMILNVSFIYLFARSMLRMKTRYSFDLAEVESPSLGSRLMRARISLSENSRFLRRNDQTFVMLTQTGYFTSQKASDRTVGRPLSWKSCAALLRRPQWLWVLDSVGALSWNFGGLGALAGEERPLEVLIAF